MSMNERVTHTICCIGLRYTTSDKLLPFFIWQLPDGTWSDESAAATWGKIKDAKAGVVYTIQGEPATDGRPGSILPSSLRYHETWRDSATRTRWVATSESARLLDRAKRQTHRLSAQATGVLAELNTTYWGLPTNQRGAFLTWVMTEVTRA